MTSRSGIDLALFIGELCMPSVSIIRTVVCSKLMIIIESNKPILNATLIGWQAVTLSLIADVSNGTAVFTNEDVSMCPLEQKRMNVLNRSDPYLTPYRATQRLKKTICWQPLESSYVFLHSLFFVWYKYGRLFAADDLFALNSLSNTSLAKNQMKQNITLFSLDFFSVN